LTRQAQRTSPSSPDQAAVAVAVVTVDDQEVFRSVAREVVEATDGFEPAGEAATGEEALRLVDEVKPQLVLVDVRMPGMDGVETARRLSRAHPDLVIVLISLEDRSSVPSTIEDSGAVAFVRKQDFGPATLRKLWASHGPATGS
jgi:DNA-binding NarL/FixJ family response regulator